MPEEDWANGSWINRKVEITSLIFWQLGSVTSLRSTIRKVAEARSLIVELSCNISRSKVRHQVRAGQKGSTARLYCFSCSAYFDRGGV